MEEKNLHEGHRKRLRKEVIINDFSDELEIHKLLEALLFYGIPRKDTNEIAHELLNTFGSFSGVLEANYNDLYSIKGMTENAAFLIKLILPLSRRYNTERYKGGYKFKSIDEIGEFLVKKHSGYNTEVFIVTTFRDNGTMISCDVIKKGDMEEVSLSVKTLVNCVLRHNAPVVIVSHNHTNGLAVPSQADIKMTQILNFTLDQMGIRLLDHIIVADDEFVSLAQSKDYKPLFIINQSE